MAVTGQADFPLRLIRGRGVTSGWMDGPTTATLWKSVRGDQSATVWSDWFFTAGGGSGATVNATLRNIFITDMAPGVQAGAIVNPGTRSTIIADLSPSPSGGANVTPISRAITITDLSPAPQAGANVTSPATRSTFLTHLTAAVQGLGGNSGFLRLRRRRRS